MLSPARTSAFDILLRVERARAYADELLHSERTSRLSRADRGLCAQIVYGVLRWRLRLDFAIGALSSQPLAKMDLEVLTALRMGAYQLGFLNRVPARAAVNDSVELVKRARKRSAAGMVNALLRKLMEHPDLLLPSVPPGPKSVLNLERLYSHPLWLAERWALRFGMETAERICAYNQQAPQVALRLRDSAAELALQEEGIQLGPGQLLRDARRVLTGDIIHSGVFAQGRVVIQDEASQLVGTLVGRGLRLLDCCAAPGGKTAILAKRNPASMIVASDLHPRRAALMHRLLRGTGGAIHVIAADATSLPLRASFDRVLTDVPCSGTGTLARNPEIKWRLVRDDLARLHSTQVAILRSAMEHLRPGGRLVYSTCSLEPQENEDVVNEVLETSRGFRLAYCRFELERLRDGGELVWDELDSLVDGPFMRTLPGVHPCDGFFAAIVERTAH